MRGFLGCSVTQRVDSQLISCKAPEYLRSFIQKISQCRSRCEQLKHFNREHPRPDRSNPWEVSNIGRWAKKRFPKVVLVAYDGGAYERARAKGLNKYNRLGTSVHLKEECLC